MNTETQTAAMMKEHYLKEHNDQKRARENLYKMEYDELQRKLNEANTVTQYEIRKKLE